MDKHWILVVASMKCNRLNRSAFSTFGDHCGMIRDVFTDWNIYKCNIKRGLIVFSDVMIMPYPIKNSLPLKKDAIIFVYSIFIIFCTDVPNQ